MAKIKFTKQELKHQQDAKKQFERFLPILQLKKQQLQLEVRLSADALSRNLESQRRLQFDLAPSLVFFDDPATVEAVRDAVQIEKVETGESNIAGINIPTYDKVVFKPVALDLFATEWFLDDAVEMMKRAVELREEYRVISRQHELLSKELDTTSQRVNLFEKIKLPECRENIRRIGIMLGDAQTASVARSKIAKKKSSAEALQ
ncbi:MAG: V-type ATP synthase subunit D [Victivallaceae bacterium]|nr:V-type ATP synthase subunit D [Victivallaceae bacterium]